MYPHSLVHLERKSGGRAVTSFWAAKASIIEEFYEGKLHTGNCVEDVEKSAETFFDLFLRTVTARPQDKGRVRKNFQIRWAENEMPKPEVISCTFLNSETQRLQWKWINNRGKIKPSISAFYGIIIYMYFMGNKQHKLPHIHVKYQEHEVIVEIPEGNVLEGNIPSSKMKLLQAWIEIHKDELMADWELAASGEHPYKIDPLR